MRARITRRYVMSGALFEYFLISWNNLEFKEKSEYKTARFLHL